MFNQLLLQSLLRLYKKSKTIKSVTTAECPVDGSTAKTVSGIPLPSKNVIQDFDGTRFGTFWELWGGHVTADHVHVSGGYKIPDFCQEPVLRWAGFLDVCMYGVTVPEERPRDPIDGEEVYVFGYPGGSTSLSARVGKLYLKRTEQSMNYTGPSYIVVINNKTDGVPADPSLHFPVIGGMSGGLCQAKDGTPLGVLVTQNGAADLDNDGVVDHSLDFYALSDVWDAYNDESWNLVS